MNAVDRDYFESCDFYLDDGDVPAGWCVVPLETIATKITDGTHKTPIYQPSGVRFISIKNIRPFQPVNWNSYEKYISETEHQELIRRCHPERDDVLFPRIGTLGFAKRVDFDEEVSIFVGLGLIKPRRDVVLPKFLEFYMNTTYISRLSAEKANGTGRMTLPLEETRRFPFPLPPLREQHRIVAKIEELFSELDKAVESLMLARAQLKTYRQALLKAAFEGKLTADWRAANADKLEPPETLLARIRAEREACHKQALDDWQAALAEWRAGGDDGRKPQKPGRPRELSGSARGASGDAPWPAVELGDVIAVSSGEGLTSADMRAGSHPVYGGNGIAGYHDEWLLNEPTLVIGRVGAKCGVTHITLPKAWVTDNALIVRPLIATFEMRFFKYLLEYMNLNALGSSTGQPVISGSKIYGQIIALPSKAEQAVAANLIETNDTAVQSADGEIEDALARIAALRQSILKQAFSGQLVPQDPADDPAAALLARLREETPAPRTRRRKTA